MDPFTFGQKYGKSRRKTSSGRHFWIWWSWSANRDLNSFCLFSWWFFYGFGSHGMISHHLLKPPIWGFGFWATFSEEANLRFAWWCATTVLPKGGFSGTTLGNYFRLVHCYFNADRFLDVNIISRKQVHNSLWEKEPYFQKCQRVGDMLVPWRVLEMIYSTGSMYLLPDTFVLHPGEICMFMWSNLAGCRRKSSIHAGHHPRDAVSWRSLTNWWRSRDIPMILIDYRHGRTSWVRKIKFFDCFSEWICFRLFGKESQEFS